MKYVKEKSEACSLSEFTTLPKLQLKIKECSEALFGNLASYALANEKF